MNRFVPLAHTVPNGYMAAYFGGGLTPYWSPLSHSNVPGDYFGPAYFEGDSKKARTYALSAGVGALAGYKLLGTALAALGGGVGGLIIGYLAFSHRD